MPCAHAIRVRSELEGGVEQAKVRQLRPYGLQFYKDWLTRLEVARAAAAGVEYMHQVRLYVRLLAVTCYKPTKAPGCHVIQTDESTCKMLQNYDFVRNGRVCSALCDCQRASATLASMLNVCMAGLTLVVALLLCHLCRTGWCTVT